MASEQSDPPAQAAELRADAQAATAVSPALVAELYVDLKRIAHHERYRVGSPATLQTTALVHEAYLKLHAKRAWNDRRHFMRVAAAAMRQVLVDAARARLTAKRGDGVHPSQIDDEQVGAMDAVSDETVIDVGDALRKLEMFSPRLAQVVECRFFAGYTEHETAEALELTSRTVVRDWIKARAWLHRELNPEAAIASLQPPGAVGGSPTQ